MSTRRAVECEFVFDRLAAAELSDAYRILVSERRARTEQSRAGWSVRDDQCGDLRPGVFGPAEGGADDRQPDRGAARARRAARG